MLHAVSMVTTVFNIKSTDIIFSIIIFSINSRLPYPLSTKHKYFFNLKFSVFRIRIHSSFCNNGMLNKNFSLWLRWLSFIITGLQLHLLIWSSNINITSFFKLYQSVVSPFKYKNKSHKSYIVLVKRMSLTLVQCYIHHVHCWYIAEL